MILRSIHHPRLLLSLCHPERSEPLSRWPEGEKQESLARTLGKLRYYLLIFSAVPQSHRLPTLHRIGSLWSHCHRWRRMSTCQHFAPSECHTMYLPRRWPHGAQIHTSSVSCSPLLISLRLGIIISVFDNYCEDTTFLWIFREVWGIYCKTRTEIFLYYILSRTFRFVKHFMTIVV